MSKNFKGIIAIAENRVIGLDNKLPWPKQFSDLAFFKQMTWGGNLIMGRKTFQGLGLSWLPNRNIYVLTKFNPFGWDKSECNFKAGKSCTTIFQSPSDLPDGDYWVAGGKTIYELFMPQMDEFIVTYIKGVFEGDVEMPEFESQFPKTYVVSENEFYKTVRMWK